MSNKLIDFINISKSYGTQTVLDDLNLYIRENEFLTLLGPSGCGKTTVTKLINGLIPHFTADGQLQGEVTVAGMPVRDTAVYELAKEVGSV